jgi:energy-coupling factor transporter ATP-binding protein EcfA2
MTHIQRLSFCGIRRLNEFETEKKEIIPDWMNRRVWYNFKPVNIFTGVNGGGKSTLLELIDVLRHPQRLTSLPRENLMRGRVSAFDIGFTNNRRLIGIGYSHSMRGFPSAPNLEPEDKSDNGQCIELVGLENGQKLFSFRRNVSKVHLDSDSEWQLKKDFALLGCNVEYWDSEIPIKAEALIDSLNEAAVHFPGVLSDIYEANDPFELGRLEIGIAQKPFHPFDESRLAIWLDDDLSQQNIIHLSALPSGWRRLASILTWLKEVPEGSACILEEPETHLHPRLQRHLAFEMDKIATKKSLQLCISTHSPVLQHAALWQSPPAVFEATSIFMEELTSPWRLLDALGIKGSDVWQSNGIIWVEGPSDRWYIKHWLRIYCQENGLGELKEHVHYSFNFYGGAVLSHMRPDDQEEFVSMLNMNRNMMLVIDRDFDFNKNQQGDWESVSPDSAKAIIVDQIRSMNRPQCDYWITDGYTMESYLPDSFRRQYFKKLNGRLVHMKGRKVEIAAKYSQEYPRFDESTCMPVELRDHIRTLAMLIKKWDS